MSTTSEVVTFSDLQNDLLTKVRVPSSAAANVTIAKRYLNQALVDVHRVPGNKFEWAHRRGVLITHAPYTTGTVSITAATSRTAVTGASTAWTTTVDGFGFANARAGGKIKFSGLNEISEVDTVVGATSITLKHVYTGDDLSAASYTYYEDEYALATDFLRFVDINMFSTDLNIPLIGAQDFRRRFGRNDTAGKPRVASQIQIGFSSTTAPRHRVVLAPYPDDEYSIPYWYVTTYLAVTSAGVEQTSMDGDTDEPIIPRGARHALVFYALYNWYRDLKDDTRSQEAKAEYIDIMMRIAGETNVGQDRPSFIMRRGRAGHPRQRFEWGGRFDSIRDRDDY